MNITTNETVITYDGCHTNKDTIASTSTTINPFYADWVKARELTPEEIHTIIDALGNRVTYPEYRDEKHSLELNNKKTMFDTIDKVIFNKPATIVIWKDGTKTIVKCDGEKFDPEKGLAMAITKRLLGGNQGYYYEMFKKWLPKKEKHSKKEVIKAVKKVRENFDREQAKKNK